MKSPRPYQAVAHHALLSALEKQKKRALVVMASGLGKTLTAAKFARYWWTNTGTKILFLVHMVDALHQAQAEFVEEFEHCDASAGFLGDGRQDNIGADVLFATFQTMQNYLEEFAEDEFGLIVVDEAHHGQADSYRDVIDWFTPEFCLAITATPERMDGLDIREVFGEEVYSYGLAEALAEGKWLTRVDYRVYFDNVSIIALRRLIKQVEGGDRTVTKQQIDNTIFLKERLSEIARIVRGEQEDGDKQTVIFCRSISHLNRVKKDFPDAQAYHSGLSKKILRGQLQAFRERRLKQILVVDKLNEAVDIPYAELLVFLRVTDSQTVWLQQLGRGLRKADGKEQVVVLDFVANCHRLFAIKSFSDQVAEIARRDELELETGWKVNFVSEAVELLKVLERIGHQSWDEMFDRLVVFKNTHGHCNVPITYTEDPRLAKWLSDQRALYKRGDLLEVRSERLKQLGLVWEVYESKWECYFASLANFKTTHGHCQVSTLDEAYPGLGQWLSHQRQLYRKGKLSSERSQKLEELGIVWNAFEAEWEARYAELCIFKQQQGHCNVPRSYVEVEGLGNWVHIQRRRRRCGELKPERIKRLDAIGFEWEASHLTGSSGHQT